jgi:hypothetical protein
MDLIVVLFEVGLFPLEGPRLKTGPISKPLAFVVRSSCPPEAIRIFVNETSSSICGEYVKFKCQTRAFRTQAHEEKTWKPPGFHRIIWGLNRRSSNFGKRMKGKNSERMSGGLKYATFFFWPVGQKEIGRRCGKNLRRHQRDVRNGY